MESNNRIGILTFHRVYNVGANLQAFALQHFIDENIQHCEIIDFYPNNHISNKSWKRKLLSFIKNNFFPSSWKINMQKRKFISFQNKYYTVSKNKYFGDSNFKNVTGYKLIISGSDQILSTSLSGNTMSYYLPFSSVHKITYGSSFGKDSLNDLEKWAILTFFPSYINISFREINGANLVSRLINLKEKNIVVDPVFLLNKKEWLSITSSIKTKHFILVYAVENTTWFLNTLKYVKTISDLPIIILSTKKLVSSAFGRTITNFGPSEFLSYISKAEFIVTNSYHGFAFSLIFEKKFLICAHSSRNARLESLAEMIAAQNKIINSQTSTYSFINGQESYKRLKSYINFSEKYLYKNVTI